MLRLFPSGLDGDPTRLGWGGWKGWDGETQLSGCLGFYGSSTQWFLVERIGIAVSNSRPMARECGGHAGVREE
jgi:hypothetical protein